MEHKTVEFIISCDGDPSVGIWGSEARLTIDVPTVQDGVADPEFIELIRSRMVTAFVDIFDDDGITVMTDSEVRALAGARWRSVCSSGRRRVKR